MAANTHATFQAQIDVANTGIAIALAGQNLTSEVQGGSYAAAQVHQRVANVLLAADASALSDTMHEVLGHWSQHNLGRDRPAPWPVWDLSLPEDLAKTAGGWSAAVAAAQSWNAALASRGLEVDLEEVARRADLPTRVIETAREGGAAGQVYQYHLTFGVLTKNEIRAGLGFPPVEGGDVPPAPIPAPAPEPTTE